MFAIAFDLVVAETAQNHPKGVSQASRRYRRDAGPPLALSRE